MDLELLRNHVQVMDGERPLTHHGDALKIATRAGVLYRYAQNGDIYELRWSPTDRVHRVGAGQLCRILYDKIVGQKEEVKEEAPVVAEVGANVGVDEEEVKMEASFVDDLGADSLDVVELVMALEEEFGLEISDEDAEKLASVKNAVDYISSHAKK